MAENDKPSELIKAAAELARTVPVYQDALQPAARVVGRSLETMARSVDLALAPVRALVWGGEKLEEFVKTKVASKLRNTPQDRIVTPNPNVAGPALESLRYNGAEEELHDLYANLLAEAMDARTANGILPSYVEMLRQLSSDEAKLLRFIKKSGGFPLVHILVQLDDNEKNLRGERMHTRSVSFAGREAGLAFPDMTAVYLDSLARLGLITFFDNNAGYISPGVYDALDEGPEVKALVEKINSDPSGMRRGVVRRSGFEITALGESFMRACLDDHASKFATSE